MSTTLEHSANAFSGIRVLLFDHTAALGGGEIALLNLVRHLDSEKVSPLVVVGAAGPLVELLRTKIAPYVLPLSARVTAIQKGSLGIASLFRIREVLHLVAYVWRLVIFMRRHKVDLVHTNSLKADIIGGVAGRLARRPVIWHIRDRIDEDYLPNSVVRIFRALCRILPSHVIANSTATLCTLSAGNMRASDSIQRAVSDGRMSVVHDGTHLPPLPQSAGQDNAFFRIGLIGRISPWKGQHIFLQAAALVAKRFSNARFFVIGAALFGEDAYGSEIRELSRSLAIETLVEFTGFCDDIQSAIAGLDLIVHASTTGEPFGQVIIEGMAAGKPVVATNGGGVPEIVEDGKTGILVPLGDAPAMADAICEVLNDPERARAMGALGRERVEHHFTIERTARSVENVYQHVLHSRKRGLKIRFRTFEPKSLSTD